MPLANLDPTSYPDPPKPPIDSIDLHISVIKPLETPEGYAIECFLCKTCCLFIVQIKLVHYKQDKYYLIFSCLSLLHCGSEINVILIPLFVWHIF